MCYLHWRSHKALTVLALLALLVGTANAEGTAAQFQGVERWKGTSTTTIDINLMGQRRHRSVTMAFILEKHLVNGSTETWEGKAKSKGSDADGDSIFSAVLTGGTTTDLKLILEMEGDIAKLETRAKASKGSVQMKIMGTTVESMSIPNSEQEATHEWRIDENAETLVYENNAVDESVQIKTLITFVPEDVPLKAVLIAGSGERGATVRLDASQSKGRIKTLRWKLQPMGESGAPMTSFETSERVVELVLLEDVKADLEVSNGRKTAKASATAKAIPRKWTTTFKQEPNDGVLAGKRLVAPQTGATLHFGQDACKFEGMDSAHGMHATRRGTWRDDVQAGYTMKVVDDPERPFDGYWYVKEEQLIVSRVALLNPDISTGSELFTVNAKHDAKETFARLVASTKEHEHMHGKLMRQELLDDDPAKRIERLVKRGEDELATVADMEIRATETRMQEGRFHEEQVRKAMRKKFAKGGKVWLRDGGGGFTAYTFASFADKGD